jgi:neutral ceramidase
MLARTLCLIATLACTVWGSTPGPGVAAEDAWQAGVARIRITPEPGMWMAGYASRDRPADGTLTELWAKALVLEDAAGHRGVLITADLIGFSRELSQAICEDLAEPYGLERGQIAICASHTHTGPALWRNLAPLHYLIVDPDQQQRIEAYTRSVQGKIVEVTRRALQNLEPAQLAWGSGRATFAVNRRNNRPENLVEQLRAEGKLQGPVDHDVPVLAVRDSRGDLACVVFGYACHATVLSSYEWSGDYPGFAQLELESRHPGCQAMFWAGCGADQNPLPRRTVALAREYGRQLASAVEHVLDGKLDRIQPGLATRYQEIQLPFAELPSPEAIRQDLQATNRYVAARARSLLDQIQSGQPLQPCYPYPVQVWRLGQDVQWIFLGGEVVVDFATRLKQELGDRKTWVAGYANDVMAYIGSRRILREGGYEGETAMVYYGLPTRWAPESEDCIVTEVHRQVHDQQE